MKRKIIIVLLGLGTIGGFAIGVKSLHWHARNHHQHFGRWNKHHTPWERRIANACLEAAREAKMAPATKAVQKEVTAD